MKIAITANEDKLSGMVDQRFGRCPFFLIVNVDNDIVGTFEAIENTSESQAHGAGINAAELMGEQKVDAIITGELGPNATKVLEQLNIPVYSGSGKIIDVLDEFVENKLEKINTIATPHSTTLTKVNSENEKIFFPLLNDKGLDSEISQHFGHAPFFGLYDVNTKEFKIIKNDLDHTNPNKSPIDQIQDAVNPTTIFAKGIGSRAIQIIKEKGLGLKTGDYDTVKEVLDNFDSLDEQIKSCGHEH